MSFITQFFIKPAKPRLIRLPSGSFTVDQDGSIMASTLPQSFPVAELRQLGGRVLAAFRAGNSAGINLTELSFQYPRIKLVARANRGGAIIFFHPE